MIFFSFISIKREMYQKRAEIALKKEIDDKMKDETVAISKKTLDKINKVLELKTKNKFKYFEDFFNKIQEEGRFKRHIYNVTYHQNKTSKFDYLIFSRR